MRDTVVNYHCDYCNVLLTENTRSALALDVSPFFDTDICQKKKCLDAHLARLRTEFIKDVEWFLTELEETYEVIEFAELDKTLKVYAVCCLSDLDEEGWVLYKDRNDLIVDKYIHVIYDNAIEPLLKTKKKKEKE